VAATPEWCSRSAASGSDVELDDGRCHIRQDLGGGAAAVAALFGSARRHIQTAVDQRFNRRKYDASNMLEAPANATRDPAAIAGLVGRLTDDDPGVRAAAARTWSARQPGRWRARRTG
jgi:hypothetical protein